MTQDEIPAGSATKGIRLAAAGASPAISALALRSKAHWGYDASFLDAARGELTFSEADIASELIWIAEVGTALAGFHLVRGSGPEGELEAIFVDEPFIGRGIGRSLLLHAFETARARGIRQLELDADPGAESFYRHFGAQRIGESPSGSIPGRLLPRMRFDLTPRRHG